MIEYWRNKTAIRDIPLSCQNDHDGFWTGSRSFINLKARLELMLLYTLYMYVYVYIYLCIFFFFFFWNFEETIGSCIMSFLVAFSIGA